MANVKFQVLPTGCRRRICDRKTAALPVRQKQVNVLSRDKRQRVACGEAEAKNGNVAGNKLGFQNMRCSDGRRLESRLFINLDYQI